MTIQGSASKSSAFNIDTLYLIQEFLEPKDHHRASGVSDLWRRAAGRVFSSESIRRDDPAIRPVGEICISIRTSPVWTVPQTTLCGYVPCERGHANRQFLSERGVLREYGHASRGVLCERGHACEIECEEGGRVQCVAFSPDGKSILSGTNDGILQIRNSTTGVLNNHNCFNAHTDRIASVAFSPDGKSIVSGSCDAILKIWNSATGALLQTLNGHNDGITCVAFSPDGKSIVSGSSDTTLKIWNSETGALLQTLSGHNWSITCVAFSPDGKSIVSGSGDTTLKIWNSETGDLLQTLSGHNWSITCVAFSPDGKSIVSGSGDTTLGGSGDTTLKIWNSETGALLQTLRTHMLCNDPLLNYMSLLIFLAFSPDGKNIIFAIGTGIIGIWDSKTGTFSQILVEENQCSFQSVALSPDGKRIISALTDGTLQIRKLASPEEKMIRAVNSRNPLFLPLCMRGETQKQIVAKTINMVLRNTLDVISALYRGDPVLTRYVSHRLSEIERMPREVADSVKRQLFEQRPFLSQMESVQEKPTE